MMDLLRLFTTALAAMIWALPQRSVADQNWPSFRGHRACGVAEGFATSTTWDVERSKNIRWTTAIGANKRDRSDY